MKSEKELKKELDGFIDFWHGGTSRAKMGWKKSVKKAIFEDLEAIVDICITPFVTEDTDVLEIGADGGFWTQKMTHAKSLYCFDSLSAKHNGFWNRVAKKDKIKYFQVQDFLCNDLEDDSIDYLFSYDVFCHISYSGTDAYLENLWPKLRHGANCFIMIADADKYYYEPGRKKLMTHAGFENFDEFAKDYDGTSSNGRWYFYGTELFCESLSKYGYELVSKDVAVEADKLSPIIHFKKR